MIEQRNRTYSLSLGNYRQTVFNLSGILRKLKEFSQALHLKESAQLTEQLLQRLETNSFSIAVVGEFKRGKSTFINALLGREILPSDILPTTATLNRVTYGLKPSVKICFKEGGEEEIAIEQLTDYVTKLTPESERRALSIREATVYYPTHYCQHNIDIIDTPGLSEDETMTALTLSVLPEVDAAIMVVMAQSPFSDSERQFLQNQLLTQDLGRIIFVVTGIDRCHSLEEAERVVQGVEERLKTHILQGVEEECGKNSEEYKACVRRIREPKVFGISAYEALQAKREGNADLLKKSRFLELEDALEQFLTEERGIVFLQVPINRAIASAQEILAAIDNQESELKKRQDKLRSTYATTVRTIEKNLQRKQDRQERIENIRQRSQTALNQLYPALRQAGSQAIDSLSIAKEDFHQSVILKRMLEADRQIAEALESHSRILADQFLRQLQQGLSELDEDLQLTSDELAQLLHPINQKFLNLAEILGKSIVDRTGAWKAACALKKVGGKLNLNFFKKNYQAAIFQEIAKQLNLNPIHQQVYDLIKATLQKLSDRVNGLEKGTEHNDQVSLAQLKTNREREETLFRLKSQKLNEMQTETEALLAEAQVLLDEMMEIMKIE